MCAKHIFYPELHPQLLFVSWCVLCSTDLLKISVEISVPLLLPRMGQGGLGAPQGFKHTTKDTGLWLGRVPPTSQPSSFIYI